MTVRFHGLTDVGRRRSLNEDAIYAKDGLFLVCDGMGGHHAGEVASQLATDAIAGFIRRSTEDPEMTWPYSYDTALSYEANCLTTAIKLANRVVHRKASSAEEYTGMGTTVAAALVHPRRSRMTYANVGDSRIYFIRSSGMRQLTHDDTWANLDWRDAQLPAHQLKNILTKALGAREDVDFSVAEQLLEDGDLVLICSDGLTGMLSDDQILEIVSANGANVQTACERLLSEASAAGGRDNISAILIRHETT
jgi:serine/threonine protein phosphatase PrpC